jgi:heme O synthase-like polyprenyltransferase
MTATSLLTQPSTTDHFTSKLRDYYILTKPEVNMLILMTTSAGYYLASRGNFRVAGLVNTLVGTVLVASGTATLNQWMERVWDGQMRRTATRPLPSGRLSAREALLFGILLSVAGGLYLALAVNALSALLAMSTVLSYLYLAAMALAGAFLLYHVAKLVPSTSKLLARRVVFASVIYLPLILGIMIAWKRVLG